MYLKTSPIRLLFSTLLWLIPVIMPAKFILVIDAGHGGKDPGAIGTYSKEKNINLNVALKFGAYVEKNCPDVQVIYTRKTDVFVTLIERANIANRAKANLFISIHTNSLPNGRIASGSETYSLGMARAKENLDVAKRENSVILYESNYQERYAGFNPNQSESYIIFDFMQDQQMKQSAELAKAIQQQYSAAGRPDKGVHQAGFLVLRETSMPSVLTELGFISTPQEERYLNSQQGVEELARSIYNGFLHYRKNLTHDGGTDLPRPEPANEQTNEPATQEETQTAAEQKESAQNNEPSDKNDVAPEKSDVAPEKTEKAPAKTDQATQGMPVFKIQICSSGHKLREDASQFKKLTPVEYYQENNLYKYTYGTTPSYKEIVALKKSIQDKFPDCFIVAFKGTQKISVQEALKQTNKK